MKISIVKGCYYSLRLKQRIFWSDSGLFVWSVLSFTKRLAVPQRQITGLSQ